MKPIWKISSEFSEWARCMIAGSPRPTTGDTALGIVQAGYQTLGLASNVVFPSILSLPRCLFSVSISLCVSGCLSICLSVCLSVSSSLNEHAFSLVLSFIFSHSHRHACLSSFHGIFRYFRSSSFPHTHTHTHTHLVIRCPWATSRVDEEHVRRVAQAGEHFHVARDHCVRLWWWWWCMGKVE